MMRIQKIVLTFMYTQKDLIFFKHVDECFIILMIIIIFILVSQQGVDYNVI